MFPKEIFIYSPAYAEQQSKYRQRAILPLQVSCNYCLLSYKNKTTTSTSFDERKGEVFPSSPNGKIKNKITR